MIAVVHVVRCDGSPCIDVDRTLGRGTEKSFENQSIVTAISCQVFVQRVNE